MDYTTITDKFITIPIRFNRPYVEFSDEELNFFIKALGMFQDYLLKEKNLSKEVTYFLQRSINLAGSVAITLYTDRNEKDPAK